MDKWQIELEALKTEREAMIADNLERQRLGSALAYHGDSFMILAERIRDLYREAKRRRG